MNPSYDNYDVYDVNYFFLSEKNKFIILKIKAIFIIINN